MSGANEMVLGAVTFGPAPTAEEFVEAYTSEHAMAVSIVGLLKELEETRAERDFYKAAASKLMSGKPHNGRRKQ